MFLLQLLALSENVIFVLLCFYCSYYHHVLKVGFWLIKGWYCVFVLFLSKLFLKGHHYVLLFDYVFSIFLLVFQRIPLCLCYICLSLLCFYYSWTFKVHHYVFAMFVCLCYVYTSLLCFCCSWFYQKMAPSPRSPPPGSIFPDNWCRNFRPPQPSPESRWQHSETTSCLRYGVYLYAVKSVLGWNSLSCLDILMLYM